MSAWLIKALSLLEFLEEPTPWGEQNWRPALPQMDMVIIILPQTASPHSIKFGNNCCTQRSTVEDILKTLSNTIHNSQSHIFFKLNPIKLNLIASNE